MIPPELAGDRSPDDVGVGSKRVQGYHDSLVGHASLYSARSHAATHYPDETLGPTPEVRSPQTLQRGTRLRSLLRAGRFGFFEKRLDEPEDGFSCVVTTHDHVQNHNGCDEGYQAEGP